jgi:hypothetical protein
MATGSLIASGIHAASAPDGAWSEARTPVDLAVAVVSQGAALQAGALVSTQPIDEIEAGLTGSLMRAFTDDYYNRMHFSALAFSLGNIIAGVSRVLTMWNSYLVPKSVGITSSTGTAGMSASGTGALGPETLRPLQVGSTTFQIGTDGDPILRARYTYTIDDPA